MAIHVKNKDLREELIKSKENGELTAEAVRMIMLMAEKFSTKFNKLISSSSLKLIELNQ